MTHANAALTPRGRLKLARLIVEQRCPISQAATRFQVSWPTAKRWAKRYELEGEAGMADRSSRPHSMPAKTPAPVVRKIVHLRWKQRLGPVEIAARVGVAASTAHQVLVRCRISRLSHVDRATGEPVRRYEHPHPGSMIHVDVKKLGNNPDQGGWRYVGRVQGAQEPGRDPGRRAVDQLVQRDEQRLAPLGRLRAGPSGRGGDARELLDGDDPGLDDLAVVVRQRHGHQAGLGLLGERQPHGRDPSDATPTMWLSGRRLHASDRRLHYPARAADIRSSASASTGRAIARFSRIPSGPAHAAPSVITTPASRRKNADGGSSRPSAVASSHAR